jgi:hypothetical protein
MAFFTSMSITTNGGVRGASGMMRGEERAGRFDFKACKVELENSVMSSEEESRNLERLRPLLWLQLGVNALPMSLSRSPNWSRAD